MMGRNTTHYNNNNHDSSNNNNTNYINTRINKHNNKNAKLKTSTRFVHIFTVQRFLATLLIVAVTGQHAAAAITAPGSTRLGSKCQHDMDCTDFLKGSTCSASGYCECAPYFVQFNATTCLSSQLLGGDCILDDQCTMKVANSSCADGACRCVEGFLQFRKHTCLGPAHPGAVCYSHAHCQMFDTRTHCDFLIPNLFGRCQCTAPTKLRAGLCVDASDEHESEEQQPQQQPQKQPVLSTTTMTNSELIFEQEQQEQHQQLQQQEQQQQEQHEDKNEDGQVEEQAALLPQFMPQVLPTMQPVQPSSLVNGEHVEDITDTAEHALIQMDNEVSVQHLQQQQQEQQEHEKQQEHSVEEQQEQQQQHEQETIVDVVEKEHIVDGEAAAATDALIPEEEEEDFGAAEEDYPYIIDEDVADKQEDIEHTNNNNNNNHDMDIEQEQQPIEELNTMDEVPLVEIHEEEAETGHEDLKQEQEQKQPENEHKHDQTHEHDHEDRPLEAENSEDTMLQSEHTSDAIVPIVDTENETNQAPLIAEDLKEEHEVAATSSEQNENTNRDSDEVTAATPVDLPQTAVNAQSIETDELPVPPATEFTAIPDDDEEDDEEEADNENHRPLSNTDGDSETMKLENVEHDASFGAVTELNPINQNSDINKLDATDADRLPDATTEAIEQQQDQDHHQEIISLEEAEPATEKRQPIAGEKVEIVQKPLETEHEEQEQEEQEHEQDQEQEEEQEQPLVQQSSENDIIKEIPIEENAAGLEHEHEPVVEGEIVQQQQEHSTIDSSEDNNDNNIDTKLDQHAVEQAEVENEIDENKQSENVVTAEQSHVTETTSNEANADVTTLDENNNTKADGEKDAVSNGDDDVNINISTQNILNTPEESQPEANESEISTNKTDNVVEEDEEATTTIQPAVIDEIPVPLNTEVLIFQEHNEEVTATEINNIVMEKNDKEQQITTNTERIENEMIDASSAATNNKSHESTELIPEEEDMITTVPTLQDAEEQEQEKMPIEAVAVEIENATELNAGEVHDLNKVKNEADQEEQMAITLSDEQPEKEEVEVETTLPASLPAANGEEVVEDEVETQTPVIILREDELIHDLATTESVSAVKPSKMDQFVVENEGPPTANEDTEISATEFAPLEFKESESISNILTDLMAEDSNAEGESANNNAMYTMQPELLSFPEESAENELQKSESEELAVPPEVEEDVEELPDLVAEDTNISEEKVIAETIKIESADDSIPLESESSLNIANKSSEVSSTTEEHKPDEDLTTAASNAVETDEILTEQTIEHEPEQHTLSPAELPFDMTNLMDGTRIKEPESDNLILETSTVYNQLSVDSLNAVEGDQSKQPQHQHTEAVTTSPNDIVEITTQTMLGLASRVTLMEPAAPIVTTLRPFINTAADVDNNKENTDDAAQPLVTSETPKENIEHLPTEDAITTKPTNEIRKRVELGLEAISLGLSCTNDRQCQLADSNSICNERGVCDCAVAVNDATKQQCSAKSTGCSRGTFQCRSSGVCISWFFVCDGRPDCNDASDEECTFNERLNQHCPAEAFKCERSGRCISRAARCDGRKQCAHGEDELDCNTLKQLDGNSASLVTAAQCPPHTFRCKSGECLPEYEYCNAIISCKDGSDEPPHLCGSRAVPNLLVRLLSAVSVGNNDAPSSNAYCPHRCSNGRCRSTAIVCSGRDGCGDGTDEQTCSVCRCPAKTISLPVLSYSARHRPMPLW